MPEKCKYEQEYYDFTSGEVKTYKCEEDAVKDGYCIFHHPEYWKEHKEEVRKKFMEKVEYAINNKKPLICIGYQLPKVDLSQKTFESLVYFTKAFFHEEAEFNFAIFFSDAYFHETKFSSYANFFGAEFYF